MTPRTDRPGAPCIGYEAARTLPGLFRARLDSSPDRPAYCQFQDGAWRDTTWAEMARLVARRQRGLATEGLEPGERVALSPKP